MRYAHADLRAVAHHTLEHLHRIAWGQRCERIVQALEQPSGRGLRECCRTDWFDVVFADGVEAMTKTVPSGVVSNGCVLELKRPARKAKIPISSAAMTDAIRGMTES